VKGGWPGWAVNRLDDPVFSDPYRALSSLVEPVAYAGFAGSHVVGPITIAAADPLTLAERHDPAGPHRRLLQAYGVHACKGCACANMSSETPSA
jgi:hypothetical protein